MPPYDLAFQQKKLDTVLPFLAYVGNRGIGNLRFVGAGRAGAR